MPIDTRKAAKRLKELGFDEEQSEGVAERLSDLDVAGTTKGDLDDVEERLTGDLDDVEERLRTEMNAQEERVRRELTIRIYGAAAFVTAVLTVVNYAMG